MLSASYQGFVWFSYGLTPTKMIDISTSNLHKLLKGLRE